MSFASNSRLPIASLIDARISDLKSLIARVGTESLDLRRARGRILADQLTAFRDSPAIDVSAMDGYAVRIQDLDGAALPISGIAKAGGAPVELKPRTAVRIFTGGPVPSDADCVVKREDCNESESYVSMATPSSTFTPGQNIRRQGENARKGTAILNAGVSLTPERLAAAITFSQSTEIRVHRKVRVAILNTGDELFDLNDVIEPWQIRDSNGPYLEAALSCYAWSDIHRQRIPDRLEDTRLGIQEALRACDAILLSGGVSMGDTDYVPDAITDLGCRILFHRLPIRPGKPVLGAVGPNGQLILGLPGNPMSAAVTFRRIGLELMQHVAGMESNRHWRTAHVETSDAKTADLTWFRLVRWRDRDTLTLVTNQGSGDIAALNESDGFVEVAPNQMASGDKPFFPWTVGE